MLSRERAQGLRVRPSCPRFGLRSAVLTRIHVADDRTEIGAQRWNLANLHTLPLEARWVENQLCKKMDVRHSVGHQSNSRISQDTMLSVYIQT